ncbi:hypothetical protein BV898_19253 [Hypsibius exemplaris]|uniref:Uncharacterized protein n=1 Tax=Hypsibius exemplaris TaxID=2072580 RepID=A0A9X6RPK6_HYPEX|nr:hypothetical protein BV898_19253 [Hypsibius exemplaris]
MTANFQKVLSRRNRTHVSYNKEDEHHFAEPFRLHLGYCLITRRVLGSPFPLPVHAGDGEETNDHHQRTSPPLNTHKIISLNPGQTHFCPGDSDDFPFICRNKSPDIRACMDEGGTGVVRNEDGHFELAVHVRNEDSANAWYFCASACTQEELARTTRYLETTTCLPCPTASRSAGTSLQGTVNGTFKSIATAHPDSLSPPKDANTPQPSEMSVKFTLGMCILLVICVAAVVCWLKKTFQPKATIAHL